jgi:hypothetical protein
MAFFVKRGYVGARHEMSLSTARPPALFSRFLSLPLSASYVTASHSPSQCGEEADYEIMVKVLTPQSPPAKAEEAESK